VKDPETGIRSKTSIITLTLLCLKFLSSLGIELAGDMLKKSYDWLRRNDKRWPSEKDLAGGGEDADREKAIARIREIIKDIG